jgi:hypothetical protein
MNNTFNIKPILAAWGQQQHRLPTNNDSLKAMVLSRKISLEEKPLVLHSSLSWFPLVISGVAVLIFLLNSVGLFQKDRLIQNQIPSTGVALPEDAAYKQNSNYLSPSNNLPISDAREFLKKDYNATIRTRDVETLTTRVQTMVRGFNGRVDGSSSSEKFGYISFVVPASSLDAFRLEIKSLVPNKLYIEQTSTQNLLPQKQVIEEQRANVSNTLAQLADSRNQLVASHLSRISGLQSRLKAIAKESLGLPPEDPKQQQLAAEKISLQKKINS